ncbi:lachesin isoform X2 [Parasteatoda tepidariorum]|uniref:lachesin isoform X2 n=1 Tax=Parasteatoda tepidariorum TaxID=114398 RepID=UPI0039BC25C2
MTIKNKTTVKFGKKLKKKIFSDFIKFLLCGTLVAFALATPSLGDAEHEEYTLKDQTPEERNYEDEVSAEDEEEAGSELRRTSNEAEPEFSEAIPNITIPVGRDIQLPCIVENLGSYRAAWIKVETKAILTIHHHIITRNYRISLSHSDNRNFVLHIRNVQKSDRGGYMCQINTVPMKSQIGYVDVLVPPDIIMNESSTDITAREGTNVSLLCKAKGYPSPNISWRREDNQPIPLGMWHGKKLLATSFDGNQLNISRVSRLHMGAYLCIASNGVPPSVSRRILLHVNFPPVMWIPNQLVGAPLEKDVTLDCHTEAYPASINYWAKDGGDMIINDAKYETSIKEKNYKIHMKLAIRNLQPHDFGTYKCFAENSLGSTEGSIRLYEIPPPTSEPTKDTAAIRRQSTEDGKYRAPEETASAQENAAQQANKKRNRHGMDKVSEDSSGSNVLHEEFKLYIITIGMLILYLSMCT